MGKKSARTSENEESGDQEIDITPQCPHLGKALSLSRIRNAIKSGDLKDLSECKDCSKGTQDKDREKGVEEFKDDEFPEEDMAMVRAIWLCLQCAHRGCSRYTEGQHGVKHQNVAHSDPHDVALNCYTWQVWCYKCDEYVNCQQTKNLENVIELVKNSQAKKARKTNQKEVEQIPTISQKEVTLSAQASSSSESPASPEDIGIRLTTIETPIEQLRRPKGLSNLGNTCFFNSVMQNLSQTHLLMDRCVEACEDDVRWTVQPMGKSCVIRDMKILNLQLSESGQMTASLCEFFKEMRFGSKEVFSPGSLFHHICQKSPQFRGFQQQDSHELLRHLFEGVFNEESKRKKSSVLAHFGLKKNVAPESVKGHIKQQIDAYKKHTHHTFLETVFGGLLINTILCLECRKSSQNFEPFVDLSLPIVGGKQPKSNVPRRVDPVMDELEERYGGVKKQGPSKHQKMKAKKQKKKEAKRKRRESTGNASTDAASADGVGGGEKESGQNASLMNGEEAENEDGDVEESGESSNEEGKDGSDSGIDSILAKVTDIGINGRRTSGDDNNEDSGVDVVFPEAEEDALIQAHKEEWKQLSLSTLGDRSALNNTPGEYSVASCLTSFTDEELLTGKNKFGCDNCTEARGEIGKNGKKERVYTDAKMQLLVLIPPAVLTLHLKRFMQEGFRLKKNGSMVSFPKILDLAPFCSKACINLPYMMPHQKKILYSLYGMVEHSGSLHGGHYTAHVKVRPNSREGERFLNQVPLNMGLDDLIREMHRRCTEEKRNTPDRENAQVDEEISIAEGRWYYISDSHVRETTETSALNSQAYILFYERLS